MRQHIILSLSDIVRAIKEGRFFLYLGAAVFGCSAFLYLMLKPISFTSMGVFNGNISHPTTPLAKALEFLGKEEKVSDADTRSLLRSYPVLEAVVRSLNLQATLTEKEIGKRFREIWYTLKTAKAYRRLKKHKIPSRIPAQAVYIPDHLIIPDRLPKVVCTQVEFPHEISHSLTILFQSENSFKVFERTKLLGEGKLDHCFEWDRGSFTLSGKAKKGKKLYLHLLPLQKAVECLKSRVKILKNK
jgi:hypothetical protein